MNRPFRRADVASLFLIAGIITFFGLVSTTRGASPSPTVVQLASADKWIGESATAREEKGEVEFELTVNYKIGRVASPTVAAKAGDLFTFAADVTTEFPPSVASYYRFWISLEFFEGERVIETASSGELVGAQENKTLLAVTGIAPAGTTEVRAILHAQNKYWNLIKNRAVATHVRLLKLSGDRGGPLKVEATEPLPKLKDARAITLTAHGDWPDGTAVTIETTRGETPPTSLMANGRAEFVLRYATEDVGSASVTARVADQTSKTVVPDPYAGVLMIDQILADDLPTPALARLSRNGEMLPGRYQSSVPGIFISPPYKAELAPGEWHLEISRGPQFQPIEQELQIVSGDRQRIEEVHLRRLADLRRNGWYGGDADGDVYHGERIYSDVTAQTAADIAQAVGLDWVGVANWGIKPKTWAEAKAHMRSLGSPQLLFMWTDERPKTTQGHACFVGLLGPDNEPLGWAWAGLNRPMENFEVLQGIRAHGGATFVNHPLRWWMKGERFNTNMYGSLPFDLCAAAALDGFNINEGKDAINVWSMLLDHGYRVAATAGADFGLDRPAGPLPGNARMYCFCPDGLSEAALSKAVRNGHTMVSTGPVLLADIEGAPPGSVVSPAEMHQIRVQAWARGDQSDPLKRLELWAHGKVLAERQLNDDQSVTEEFNWQPSGESDWVAVRVISQRGWAMTSAFYADGNQWRPKHPVECELTLDVHGLDPAQIAKSKVEVWDRAPALAGSQAIQQLSLTDASSLTVPVTATIVVRAPGLPVKESTVFDALGVREIIDKIAAGEHREQPLLEWKTYQQVLDRCQSAALEMRF